MFGVTAGHHGQLAISRVRVTPEAVSGANYCTSVARGAAVAAVTSWQDGGFLCTAWVEWRWIRRAGFWGFESQVRCSRGPDAGDFAAAFEVSASIGQSLFGARDLSDVDLISGVAGEWQYVALFHHPVQAVHGSFSGVVLWRAPRGDLRGWRQVMLPDAIQSMLPRSGAFAERSGLGHFFFACELGHLLQLTIGDRGFLAHRSLTATSDRPGHQAAPDPFVRPACAGVAVLYAGRDGGVWRVLPWDNGMTWRGETAHDGRFLLETTYDDAAWTDSDGKSVRSPGWMCLHAYGGLPYGWSYDRLGPFPKGAPSDAPLPSDEDPS